jgi:hypothetical protein
MSGYLVATFSYVMPPQTMLRLQHRSCEVYEGKVGAGSTGARGRAIHTCRRCEPPPGQLSRDCAATALQHLQSIVYIRLNCQDALDALECGIACHSYNIGCLKTNASSLAIDRAQSVLEYVARQGKRTTVGNMAHVLYRPNGRRQWSWLMKI